MKHTDSGLRCLVRHPDQEGQCMWCSTCKRRVPPKDWDGECPGAPQPRHTEAQLDAVAQKVREA